MFRSKPQLLSVFLPLPDPSHKTPTAIFHPSTNLLLSPPTQVMFREHRESSSTSFRELPGSMQGTALHVYRRASAGTGGAGAPPARDVGSGRVGGSSGAGLAASRGRGGAALRGRGGVGKGQKEVAPQSFALLTSMGIYHGSLALGSQVRMK